VEIMRRRESIEHLAAQRLTRRMYTCRAFAEVYSNLLRLPGLTPRERTITAAALSRAWRSIGNLLVMRGQKSVARRFFGKAFVLELSAASAVKYVATLLPQKASKLFVRKQKNIITG